MRVSQLAMLTLGLLVLVATAACDPGRTDVPTPMGARTVIEFGWGAGSCDIGWRCHASVGIVDGHVHLTSTAIHGDGIYSTDGRLTPDGAKGLEDMATAVLVAGVPSDSGSCGFRCDGVTFHMTIGSGGSAAWAGTWGVERKASPMKPAYERLAVFVRHIATCRDERWVRVEEPCEPIPSAER